MVKTSKRVVISVINDVIYDQRVQKVAFLLNSIGFDVLVIGRKLPSTQKVGKFPFRIVLLRLPVNKGPFFYILFQIFLFFRLLFTRSDIFHSNDLDTLLPNFLVSKLRNKELVYDSHELFTHVPELKNRPLIRKIWQTVEKIIFPKLRYVITVNDSIANFYHKQYGNSVIVVRNVPMNISIQQRKRSDFGLPSDKKMIIMQGSGINIDRGAEELLLSMKFVNNAFLVFAGSGDVFEKLMIMTQQENLQEKVFFFRKMPYTTLMSLTSLANCGVTLDKPSNLNYLYSLPNKLFDYIKAGIPILASDLPEVSKIVKEYNIGLIVKNHDPEEIAIFLNKILFEIPSYFWSEGLKKAAAHFDWNLESNKIRSLYEKISAK